MVKTKQINRSRILALTRQRRKRQRGQMAIFVVLIFQVLFVFFAMALNVALVVHDKINLQNSVDLAALYGAQKQAEVLNVLAHINFQMRQNFKLLTWRYRVLGSMTYIGDIGNRSSSKPKISGPYWCPYAVDNSGVPLDGSYKPCQLPSSPPGSSPPNPCDNSFLIYPQYCDVNYFVCVSSAIWQGRGNHINVSVNHCKHLQEALQPVVPFPIVPGNPLIGPVTTLLGGTIALGNQISAMCKYEGLYNWLMTQMFLAHFRLDQKDRKVMIREIYKRTLQMGLDLDGNSIEKGVRETFQKNLTYTNKTNFPDPTALVRFHSPQGKEFKDFFTPINIYPVLEYLDFPSTDRDDSSSLSASCGESKRKPHYQLPKVIPSSGPIVPVDINFPAAYQQFMGEWLNLFALSTNNGAPPITPGPSTDRPLVFFTEDQLLAPFTLGYERTKEVFYYGVSIALNYEAAFPLFFPGLAGGGNLQLKASAFAKPFGGRMGPKKAELDPRIEPIRIDSSNANFATGNTYLLKPNYSRYPGDQWGLIHRDVYENYYLKRLNATINSPPIPWPYDMIYFSHLSGGDPLAYDSRDQHFLFLRMMELMAVAPDLYDLTYYSPLNHYMTAYFPRICHLFTQSDCPDGKRDISIGNVTGGGVTVEAFLRGDFGFPYTRMYSDKNKNQLGVSSPLSSFYFNLGKTNFRVLKLGGQEDTFINRVVAPWLVNDPAHFLTAWVPTPAMERYDDYSSFPTDIFGKCRAVAKDGEPVPSGCVTGGRAGYSVKLISCEMAKTFQPAPSSTIACP